LGEEARFEQVLAEVAEELAVVGAVELVVGEVADVPDAVTDNVVTGAAELPEGLFQDLERHLGERLRLADGSDGHCERRLTHWAGTKMASPERLSTTEA